MNKDVSTLLEEMQTGQYIPGEEEQSIPQNQPMSIGLPAGIPTPEELKFKLSHPALMNTNQSLGMEAAQSGWGTSEYDVTGFEPDMDLEHKRALEQPIFWKIANGAAKGGIIAATTAVNTVAGVIDGLIEGVADLDSDFDIQRAVGRGTNNFVSRTMQNINELAEEWYPNYRTEEERSPEYQSHWHRHLLAPNFIGDSFLKNFGFIIGAVAGGSVWSKAINSALRSYTAGKLMKGVTAAASGNAEAAEALKETMGLIDAWAAHTVDEAAIIEKISGSARQLNKMKSLEQLFGGVVSAFGEGIMEGEMAHRESMDRSLERINGKYEEDVSALREQFVEELKESNPNALLAIPYIGEDGLPHYKYILNEDGEKLLQSDSRYVDLVTDYQDRVAFAKDQADRVAAYTTELNIPVLTLDNTLMFGRMFSGGWKSARKNIIKVAGGLEKDAAGKMVSNYAGKKAGVEGVLKAMRDIPMEGAEEMIQGYVSSGSQKVADDRLTSFNDDGYDRESLRGLSSWMPGMSAGGREYLGDWTNWQEGFLGLLTGGVTAGARAFYDSGRKKAGIDKTSDEVASRLNEIVQQERYKNMFKAFSRHQKYNRQMEEGALKNDQYTWKTASDKQLIGDIMSFARAGRLQDLYELVDTYASATDAELKDKGAVEAATSTANQQEAENNPEKITSSIREQATDVKNAIKMYNDMYDALAALAPEGISEDQLEEMIATAMNIKAFETRFLGMFDKALSEIDKKKYARALSNKDMFGEEIQNEEEKEARLKDIYNTLTQLYTGTDLTDITFKDLIDAPTIIQDLRSVIESDGNTELLQLLDDMDKVADDRKNFLVKLTTLRSMDPADFNEKAMNPEKAAAEQKREKAAANTKDINGVQDIHDKMAEMTPQDRADYLQTLRDIEDENPSAKQYLKMNDTFEQFKAYLAEKEPKQVKSTGELGDIISIVLDDAFRKSMDQDELVSNLQNGLMDLASLSARIQQKIDQGELPEEFASPVLINDMYNRAVEAIKKNAETFKKIMQDTAGRTNVASKPKEDTTRSSEPTGVDNPNPASTSQSPSAEQKSETPAEEPGPSPTQENTPVEPVVAGNPSPEEARVDSVVPYSDPLPSTDEAKITDRKGDSVVGYYQQSIPEILLRIKQAGTNTFVKLKDLINQLRTASDKKEVQQINQAIQELTRDFVLFDEDGKPVGKNAGFADTYKWLRDNGAFEYIATQLKVDDELVFCYMDGCPLYDGVKQVVVGVVKSRNSIGEITSVQPLTTLSRPNSIASENRAKYAYLDELYDAIMADYESREPDGSLFVFGGKTNPKTSRVFGLRPGIVPFGGENSDIKDIPSYSEEAPILMIGENNQPIMLRGNNEKTTMFLPVRNNFPVGSNPSRYGRLYYMVRNGNGSYTPVALSVENLSRKVFDSAPEGSFVDDIHKRIDMLDGLVNGFQDTDNEKLDEYLRDQLTNLNQYMVLNDIHFSINKAKKADGTPINVLHIKWGDEENKKADIYPGSENSAFDIIAGLNKPLRISPRDERRNEAKRNLKRAIEDGLINTNAEVLRQKGVNFLFDPWNPATNKFGRLVSLPTENTVSPVNAAPATESVSPRPTPESETIVETEVPTVRQPVVSEREQVQITNPVEYISQSYSELPQDLIDVLSKKGVTEQNWISAPEDVRKFFLDC